MTDNTIQRTNKFVTELQKTVPNFNIKYKNESLFIKILGILLFFNKSFMTDYTTTIGSTVYFPKKEDLEKDIPGSQIVIAHEFVHAYDAKNNILFKLLYLFPQILVPLFIIMFFMLPHIYGILSLIVGVIFLLPIIPAFWRSKDELRGYQMSLFTESELMKEYGTAYTDYNLILKNASDFFNTQFTGSSYYWMNRVGVSSQLNDTITKIKTDDIVKDDPVYNIVREALKNSK